MHGLLGQAVHVDLAIGVAAALKFRGELLLGCRVGERGGCNARSGLGVVAYQERRRFMNDKATFSGDQPSGRNRDPDWRLEYKRASDSTCSVNWL